MNLFRRLGRNPRRPTRRYVVLISGPVRSGKSTLATGLEKKLGADVVRTKGILIDEYGARPEVRHLRRQLQELGEKLDRETDGTWVAAATRRRLAHIPPRRRV